MVEWWFWPCGYLSVGVAWWLLMWVWDYKGGDEIHRETNTPEWGTLMAAAFLWPVVVLDLFFEWLGGNP